MIPAAGSLDLAHARLWARHGARPDELTWHRVEALRELAGFLDAARGTALARWTRGIASGNDAHAIERQLRAHWRAEVAEVASWMPSPWQRCIVWAGTWLDLPLVEHLVHGGEPPAWMQQDPHYRALLEGQDAIASDAETDALRALFSAPEPIRRWESEWCSLLPTGAAQTALFASFRRLWVDYASASRTSGRTSSVALRQALHERLTRLLRRAVLDPTAALVYLALVALELERLRGELVRRAVLGPALLAA